VRRFSPISNGDLSELNDRWPCQDCFGTYGMKQASRLEQLVPADFCGHSSRPEADAPLVEVKAQLERLSVAIVCGDGGHLELYD